MESPSLDIIFLGTGTSTGVPVIACSCPVCSSDDARDQRTRTSVYIRHGAYALVIDTGPDFRAQILREGLDDLDAVLFTHAHKDHISGLDDIRPINYLRKKKIDVFATDITTERLKMEYPYIFEGDYPGVPLIQLYEIADHPFHAGPLKVVPIKAMHGKMDVLGFRIGDFTYLTDADSIEDGELAKIHGSKVFVINALRRFEHYSHFTLDEALEVIGKAGVEQAYLTHISHMMGLHAEVERELPAGVALAYDGLAIKV